MDPAIDEALLDRIRTARALPSPPAVTARLIELGEDPEVGLDAIIEVLQTDAALCARLLRLANSPLYARRRRTENLRQAVTLLGIDAVLTAALSLTLLSSGSSPEGLPPSFARDRWRRSVHAGVCAQSLARFAVSTSPGDALLAALLQDVGVQVVLRLEPDCYRSLPHDCSHDDVIAAELDRLGVDHAVIGATLLEAWQLPASIVEAVADSHDEAPSPTAPELARLVLVGGAMADGINGDTGALDRARGLAGELLGHDAPTFATAVDDAVETLPELSPILDAAPPDPTVMAEMAQDVLVGRLMATQSATRALHEQLETVTSVAATLHVEIKLDPLTGLANRRHLDDVLDREFAMADQHGFPLSVLFVDLDDFKGINDRFGHGVGDHLLVQSARRISACVRDGDVVGRFGGEEFLVVLPGADTDASDAAATRLVDRFDTRPFELAPEVELRQTISVGVATFDDRTTFAGFADLVHAADVALYDAKRAGKNRWRRAGPSAVGGFATPGTARRVTSDRTPDGTPDATPDGPPDGETSPRPEPARHRAAAVGHQR